MHVCYDVELNGCGSVGQSVYCSRCWNHHAYGTVPEVAAAAEEGASVIEINAKVASACRRLQFTTSLIGDKGGRLARSFHAGHP